MATEQRTSPEQRRALRARYTPEPTPRCSHCGEEMVIKAYEDRQVCWECQGCGVFSWTSDGDVAVLAAVDDADALAGARAEVERIRAKAETVIDVLDKMKALAAHAEEMTPMLTEAAIWWGDMAALVEKALGCAERMTAPEREGASE